ncbi:ferric reductase-like transmembrane domain-containing protein [Hoeflea sp. YIM 152468]|uniref:sulfite oxidase heme-binding subunit YedZ n=1 Tax=Hoeflea sp. YIM 152468 TaxID=3031759 RepID=UPI0023D98217|nr:ferric reductase-like transmembrane domain-containing protein [Hoeflea sp. YIM 152468]MDF1606594.1 ferric reductase-like transmembrane domain-containing protein [Hoeflea sp. YIM 152468]
MNKLKTVLNTPYAFWLLLALPSFGLINSALSGGDLEPLLHPTGEFAARFMIIAMILTPLRMVFPKSAGVLWLMRRRRYLGVAAFSYAALHTLYYLIDLGSLSAVVADITKFGIWTGWVAFVIFVPLAMTSNDASVRYLRRSWKLLQRFVYPAAVATLLHWIFVHDDFGPALVHFVPLAGLEIYRIWKITGASRSAPAGHKTASCP